MFKLIVKKKKKILKKIIRIRNYFIISLLILILFNSRALAYMDPGTGTFIIQAILAFISSCIAAILMTWNKFKMLLKKLFKHKKIQDKKYK